MRNYVTTRNARHKGNEQRAFTLFRFFLSKGYRPRLELPLIEGN